ncbi:hypothetical protein NDU88_004343 [Pleurodeles waltl]|uniref:Uncharacterized protein n=1 Tax=Pleurodeles waltl TaxID=8319 RepID=A0AAV7M838_PLEWA|nr:hypothetical protein NDU88_004343 [Pleurodeles waltl]
MHSLLRSEKFTARRCGETPRNACGATVTSTHGLVWTTPPDFRKEIDATPAVRAKIPHTAHRNDVQLENKPRIPRTDPGTSGNPANQRRRLSARRKTTHDFPA